MALLEKLGQLIKLRYEKSISPKKERGSNVSGAYQCHTHVMAHYNIHSKAHSGCVAVLHALTLSVEVFGLFSLFAKKR